MSVDISTLGSVIITAIDGEIGTTWKSGGGGTVDVVSNVATDRILGRVTASSGDSEELTAAQVRTLINVEDGATADQTGAEIVSLLDTELGSSGWQSGPGSITITEKAASYNVTNDDLAGNQYHETSGATNITVTVPSGLTGSEPLVIERGGTGTVTLAAGGGVTINSRDGNLAIGGQYGAVTLVPKGSDTYTLIGDLVA